MNYPLCEHTCYELLQECRLVSVWDHFVIAMAAVCICRYQPIALAARRVYVANLQVLLNLECLHLPHNSSVYTTMYLCTAYWSYAI